MGKGFLSGSPFHIEKVKGSNTKRRNCFNCKYFDDGECTLHLTRITQNNARECVKFEIAYSKIEKVKCKDKIDEDWNENIENQSFNNSFHKNNNVSELEKLKRADAHKKYLDKIQERKNSIKRRKKIRKQIKRYNNRIKKASFEDKPQIIEEKNKMILEFKRRHKKDYDMMKKKKQIT